MAVDDSYSKILLHCNGDDASTTITDEAGNTWTAQGGAQIDTAQSKFGGASLLLDGNGDYISTPDNALWQLDGGSNSNLWTIDFWVRFASLSGHKGLLSQRENDKNYWTLTWDTGNQIVFYCRDNGVATINIRNSWTPSVNTWYHIAIVKDGTNGYKMFVDGTQIGTTQTDTNTVPNLSELLRIGVTYDSPGTAYYHNGWIDEFRFSKGIARWTSNFTPPTSAYGAVANKSRRQIIMLT